MGFIINDQSQINLPNIRIEVKLFHENMEECEDYVKGQVHGLGWTPSYMGSFRPVDNPICGTKNDPN